MTVTGPARALASAAVVLLLGAGAELSAQQLAPDPHANLLPNQDAPLAAKRKLRSVSTGGAMTMELADAPVANTAAARTAAAGARIRATVTPSGHRMQWPVDAAPAAEAPGAVLADRALVQADAGGRRMATLRHSAAPPAYAGPPLTVVDLLVGPQGLVLPADPRSHVLYRVVKPAPSGAGER